MPKLIIIGPAHPLRGGLAAFNERLASAFQELNWECKIYTFSLQYPKLLFPGKTQYSNEAPPKDLNIEIAINSINPINWIKQGLKIKNETADLIICRYWIPFMSPCLSTLLYLIKKNTNSKILCIIDNLVPHEKRFGDRLLTSLFINKPEFFVCMSETVQEELLQLRPQAKQLLLDHPVPDALGPLLSKQEARHYLKLPENKKIILFFGFIRHYKGLDLAIEAMHLLHKNQEDIQLVVAGEFYEEPSKYLDLVDKYDLNDRIHLHTHFIDDTLVKYYFSACDLVLQPYRSATQSGITPLAYYFEKPSLVTRVGSLARLIPEGLAGYVCNPDPKSISDGILHFFSQDTSKFSEFLKKEKTKFSWNDFTKKLIESAGLDPEP